MVRKSLRSPREDSYYNQNKDDDDFSILTSDFAAKAGAAAITNNTTATAVANTSAVNAQEEYDAFMGGLDDRQKNAIKVLDTWFQLKSSCVNQMTEMEAGNDALRDAVSRSKSARAVASNLSEKELGMKLGIGAASISYTDGDAKASEVEVKAFQKKITELEAELIEVRKELDRERSKNKKLKDASSTALKARKKDIESLKSKLKYYKKENEALAQKVVLYKQALEEAEINHDATVAAASVDSSEETVTASNTENKEETRNDQGQGETNRSSPMRYDRNMLRKKTTKASGQGNEQKLDKDTAIVAPEEREVAEDESVIVAPEEREVVEVEAADHTFDKWDAFGEKEEVKASAEVPVDDDADLTFSDLLALNHPSATQAPKLVPKFKISSSGAFGSASAISTPKRNVNQTAADAVDKAETEDRREANVDSNDEPKPSAFAMAMKNFSNGSAKQSSGFKNTSSRDAPPSVPSLDDTKAPKEEEIGVVAPAITEPIAVSKVLKEEGEKMDPSEERLTTSSPAKSKIASLAETYGASVRAKRMSFERPPSTAPVSFRKEPAPVAPVKEDISTDVVEDTGVTDHEATVETEAAEVADDTADISTPSKESTSAAAASSNIGPGSAQKELEALRSMLKGRGGMANKKRFEMFEKKEE